ncbi:hypothetical protein [Euzebya rosea]|uniref:hypothetical protein n=1 Tax=Euzebya rosea TaxID=2052804 RepID=UPI000D3EC9F9|nr:hypothetical protein [Euzebya rosea]
MRNPHRDDPSTPEPHDPALGEDHSAPEDNTDMDKADRPGGPGQTGMNPVEPGRSSPAPDDDTPAEDDVIAERRAHVEESQANTDSRRH